MLVVRFGTGATNLDELLGRAIGAICWVGGGLALLGLARADDAADDRDGITALVHLRGHQRSALARARRTTAGWVVMGTICPTAIGLAVLEVALARSLSDLWVAVVLGTGAAAFTAFASVILALVARAAAALNPHRPRLMAAALLLIPELVRTAGLTIPSVPSVLAAVLEQTLKLGAGAA
ncbi:MAG: hypothetical protein JW751_05890 [Polyangiaceae bacterium]|nr:hypothetical protein [Polyangiaceae bacterium]